MLSEFIHRHKDMIEAMIVARIFNSHGLSGSVIRTFCLRNNLTSHLTVYYKGSVTSEIGVRDLKTNDFNFTL